MVFVAKRPHLYIPELEQQTTEFVNVGLYFGTTISAEQAESWLALARAIRQTRRPIRCLWLRFANGDDSVLSTLRSFGQELVGCAAVQSLILENRIGNAEIMCLKDYLTSNTTLRGIKFLRTNLDTSEFVLLHDFFAGDGSLRVLDVYGNKGVEDEAVREMLSALLVGGSNLETLNIGESTFDDVEGVPRITESGVEAILSFVRRSKCFHGYMGSDLCVIRASLTLAHLYSSIDCTLEDSVMGDEQYAANRASKHTSKSSLQHIKA
jgi:hypothetical protein